ncbi:hypothetical protein [Streptobacillus canis]|uniref:hypothetical protein n=1 Tax=Streptobacillus canis TaxID=2678686 RepID=UPI0018CC73A9|nr:hypothetical protein [Streptobacillus canis]
MYLPIDIKGYASKQLERIAKASYIINEERDEKYKDIYIITDELKINAKIIDPFQD